MRPNIDISHGLNGDMKDEIDRRKTHSDDAISADAIWEQVLEDGLKFQSPTDDEREMLAQWLHVNHYGGDPNEDPNPAEAAADATSSTIVMIRDYQTGSPGYAGDLMLVIPNYLNAYDLFAVTENGLDPISKEGT